MILFFIEMTALFAFILAGATLSAWLADKGTILSLLGSLASIALVIAAGTCGLIFCILKV